MSIKSEQNGAEAIQEMARDRGISLPPPSAAGMGSVIWRNPATGRAVSLKRPLVSRSEAKKLGAVWTFWMGGEEDPHPILTRRESHAPPQSQTADVIPAIAACAMRRKSLNEFSLSLRLPPNFTAQLPRVNRADSRRIREVDEQEST